MKTQNFGVSHIDSLPPLRAPYDFAHAISVHDLLGIPRTSTPPRARGRQVAHKDRTGFAQNRCVAAVAQYKENRANGLAYETPNRPFPNDGVYTWDTPNATESRIRYTEGPEDKKWMKEWDSNYVFRLEREGRLDQEEPNLRTEFPVLYNEIIAARQAVQEAQHRVYEEVVREASEKAEKDRLEKERLAREAQQKLEKEAVEFEARTKAEQERITQEQQNIFTELLNSITNNEEEGELNLGSLCLCAGPSPNTTDPAALQRVLTTKEILQILRALKTNLSVVDLSLRTLILDTANCGALCDLIKTNHTLVKIDLTDCQIPSILQKRLQKAITENNDLEEVFGFSRGGSASTPAPQPLPRSSELVGIPDLFICPITKDIMKNPVMAADGFSYEKSAIEAWFKRGHRISPMTLLALTNTTLTINLPLKAAIASFLLHSPHLENQIHSDLILAIQMHEKEVDEKFKKMCAQLTDLQNEKTRLEADLALLNNKTTRDEQEQTRFLGLTKQLEEIKSQLERVEEVGGKVTEGVESVRFQTEMLNVKADLSHDLQNSHEAAAVAKLLIVPGEDLTSLASTSPSLTLSSVGVFAAPSYSPTSPPSTQNNDELGSTTTSTPTQLQHPASKNISHGCPLHLGAHTSAPILPFTD